MLLEGIIGGLVGGVVFGMMMGKMKMLPMVAKLAGGDSAGTGFFVHLVISAVIGVIYVLLLPAIGITGLGSSVTGILAGLVYGFVWWVLGANIIMPIWLKVKAMWSMPSLMGHLIYGLLLGLIVSWLI